ncbi:MAG: hypothetical protein IPJ94_24255 [Chloroflexi bacterium]|nr:hypothetical protein [Chloroflexota bacterium]
MKPTGSPQSLAILRSAYSASNGSTVSRNYHLRKEQDEMIAELADFHGESKVTVLRAIIDEWRELKLREAAE